MSQAPDIFTEYAGWMKARIVLTAAELDMFTLLDGKPLTAEELARKLKAAMKRASVKGKIQQSGC